MPFDAMHLAALVVFGHIVLPIVMLGWLASTRAADRLTVAGIVLFVGALLLRVWLSGPGAAWLGPGWSWLYAAVFLASTARQARRARSLPWRPARDTRPMIECGVALGLAAFMTQSLAPIVLAMRTPERTVPLVFPLNDGRYRVLHGGSGEALNQHAAVQAQRYALDIVAVNGWGMRASGLVPEDPHAYAIFGRPVHAPCSGRVLAVHDGEPDQTPPETDPSRPAGNHVVLACPSGTVLLAHLAGGSIGVRIDQAVSAGDRLGRVGNSGNSTEPHLHIHAMEGDVRDPAAWLAAARPLAMTFDGRFLLRGDVVER
ncbi:M23 family metallopeptidase [Marinivivus vitaminiproducens]|uniref:M23 family metallopeptidase n=1 Tax=Marinivivus vitaminiproducens TaxID=3035935 RepID=UPI0027A8D5B9|nr:M23 family metallopeptidase [Geminicoccaceae bacterium SCSIO 64248]